MNNLLITPPQGEAIGTLLLAHGAGAPMDSDFMEQLTAALNQQAIQVVRFEFPYMQQRRSTCGKRPPDRQPVLLDCWQQVYRQTISVEAVTDSLADILAEPLPGPVCIGGKSMGGRMATLFAEQQAVAGVCCFGYPFFPGGKYKADRIEHLLTATTPTLIVQGTRDPFGKPEVINGLPLSDAIDVHWLEAGDHDFKPTVRSGFTQQHHIDHTAKLVAQFMTDIKQAHTKQAHTKRAQIKTGQPIEN